MIYLRTLWLHRVFVAGRGPPLAAVSRGSSPAGMLGVSPRRLPLLPDHRLLAAWLQWMRLLVRRRALFAAHGLRCSLASGIFPDQGWNRRRLLNWRADSLPRSPSCCSVARWCPTLCDPMDCGTPGLPVRHCLLELIQSHVC